MHGGSSCHLQPAPNVVAAISEGKSAPLPGTRKGKTHPNECGPVGIRRVSIDGRKNRGGHVRHPCMPCIISFVLLLSNIVDMESPPLTWAAVYECVDAGGKSLLTNRPARLHDCRILSEEIVPNVPPSETSPLPEPSPPSQVPLPSNLPTPCAPEVNPLSQQNNLPCVRPDQSKAQPPEQLPTASYNLSLVETEPSVSSASSQRGSGLFIIFC